MLRTKLFVFLFTFFVLLSLTSANATSSVSSTNQMPLPRYVGIADLNTTIREKPSRDSAGLAVIQEGAKAYILSYEPSWLTVVHGTEDQWIQGYVLRHTIHDVQPIDPESTLPYGTTPAAYTCTISKDTPLLDAPNADANVHQTLEAGTRMAVLSINNGWAQIIRWRDYAYFYLGDAFDITPIFDVASAEPGDTLAAFVSVFNLSQEGLNPNRILNIGVACDYISRQIKPGESFSFNDIAGPYQKNRGYLEALSFVDGETVPSNGGGTCQVSSTLYNALLPLYRGITIEYRVAHGPSGAVYLPHGVDAACGNDNIDLRFRNDFPFNVHIEATEKHGVLFIAIVRDA